MKPVIWREVDGVRVAVCMKCSGKKVVKMGHEDVECNLCNGHGWMTPNMIGVKLRWWAKQNKEKRLEFQEQIDWLNEAFAQATAAAAAKSSGPNISLALAEVDDLREFAKQPSRSNAKHILRACNRIESALKGN